MGRPWRTLDARRFRRPRPSSPTWCWRAGDLPRRFDVVVCEGAGSPAEINLLGHDLVNSAWRPGPGYPPWSWATSSGAVSSPTSTARWPCSPRPSPARYRASCVNKFRGDPALLGDATSVLEARSGVPPLVRRRYCTGSTLDAEDSLALSGSGARSPASKGPGEPDDDDVSVLDVAVLRFPRTRTSPTSTRCRSSPGWRSASSRTPAPSASPTWWSCRAPLDGGRPRTGLATRACSARSSGLRADPGPPAGDPGRLRRELRCSGPQIVDLGGGRVLHAKGARNSDGSRSRPPSSPTSARCAGRGPNAPSLAAVAGYEITDGGARCPGTSAEPWSSSRTGSPKAASTRRAPSMGPSSTVSSESDQPRRRVLDVGGRVRARRGAGSGAASPRVSSRSTAGPTPARPALDAPRLLDIIEEGRLG